MTQVTVDPAVQTLLDAVAAMEGPSLAELGPEAARALYKSMALSGELITVAAIEDRTVPGPAGDIPVRIYWPNESGAEPRAVLVWYHGGGFVIGDLDTADPVARKLAAEASCIVVSVDYRLAPENPYPAAADDAWAVFRWVTQNASELGGDASRLAVGGDSAGGNLAAVTALRARDEGLALRHQLLVYPVTDLAATFGSRIENGEGYFLTRESMEWFEGSYLQGADPKDPSASPIYADLAGVAPAHVITAGFDPLRDEGEAYAQALAEAGVAVDDDRYPTMIHGFCQMGEITPIADDALAKAARAVERACQSAG